MRFAKPYLRPHFGTGEISEAFEASTCASAQRVFRHWTCPHNVLFVPQRVVLFPTPAYTTIWGLIFWSMEDHFGDRSYLRFLRPQPCRCSGSIRHWTCPQNVLWGLLAGGRTTATHRRSFSGVKLVVRTETGWKPNSYLGPLTARGACGMDVKRAANKSNRAFSVTESDRAVGEA